MSGITPLIDTLLHQVLGKRSDGAPRVLNEPVRPVSSEGGLRALHSDSRLDARSDGHFRSQQGTQAQGLSGSRPGDMVRLSPLPEGGRHDRPRAPLMPPASAQTHFTPAARRIADVLMRFPAPPSVLRPDIPLMADRPVAAQALAERLQASIRDSGLFYEAHLKRWFQGQGSRLQLDREPQMQVPASRLPSAVSGQDGLTTASSGVLDERLQGVVRQQLEMLATPAPVLRWEGDVWTGIFMALAMSLPDLASKGEDQADEKASDESPADTWHTEMTLDVDAIGTFSVALWHRHQALNVVITTHDAAAYPPLDAASASLQDRLSALALGHVRVTAEFADDGD